jgi:hypothetical protein
MTIKVNCSNVAALIGRHKFRPVEVAVEQFLSDNGISYDKELERREIEAQKLVEESKIFVERCIDTRTESDFVDAVDKYKTNIIETARERGVSKEVVSTALKEIQYIVGSREENSCINKYETANSVKVLDRNSRCYTLPITGLPFKAILAGKVDGITTYNGERAVLENKKRMKSMRRDSPYPPPEYDIIQLRCYMKLTGVKHGILNEEFPDRTSRETHIEWSDQEWGKIMTELRVALCKIMALS